MVVSMVMAWQTGQTESKLGAEVSRNTCEGPMGRKADLKGDGAMRKGFSKGFALLLVLGLVAAACSKKSDTTSPETSGGETSGTITINGDKANDHGEKSIGTETEVEVDDFYFSPTTIKAAAGTTVKLELANESNTLHNFSLDDQSIDTDVPAGEDVDVMVTIPASGSLEFFCKYHKSSGMVGQVQAS